MDILISSNLERLLYDISDKDSNKVNELIGNLNRDGKYKINNYMKENLNDFNGQFATEEEVNDSINKVFKQYNYLIDTHTGVAYTCYEKYKKESNDDTKSVILSTASPYKFSKDVLNALGINSYEDDDFTIINKLSHISNTTIPTPISKLKDAKILHNLSCEKEDILKEIKIILKV